MVKKEIKINNIDQVNKNSKCEFIMLCFAMLVVFVISVWYVRESYSLKISGDEVGYWLGAAFFLGKDWSSVASSSGYYGFGYGILLTPIMLFFGQDSMLMMRAAMVLEAVMLTSCVAAAYLCIGYFSTQVKGVARILLAMLPVLYSSNIMYVNTTLSEILLVTLIWWYTYVALRFINEEKIGLAIIIAILSVYMYSVHQRTIAVIAISVMLVACVYRKRILNPRILIIVGILGCGLLMVFALKNAYVRTMYPKISTAQYAANNLAGQTSKVIKILTSLKGFSRFLVSLIGKYYYIAVGSFMLVPLGLVYCAEIFIQYIQKKTDINRIVGLLVIVLCFFAAYLIGAIYMSSGFYIRTDFLIYGRYMEYTIGPLIVLGILYLYENHNMKIIFVEIIFTALATIASAHIIGKGASNDHMWCNCTAIADLFKSNSYQNGNVLYVGFLRGSLFLFLLLGALYFRKYFKDMMFCLVMFCICISWVSTGYNARNEKIIPWADKVYDAQADVLNNIDEQEFGLYHSYVGGFFQFLRVDAKVRYFETMEEISDFGRSLYILTYTQAEDAEQIREKQEIVYENEIYLLWRSHY